LGTIFIFIYIFTVLYWYRQFYYLLVTWWWPSDRGRNMLSP